ncbi:hypothetical protein GBAR_LOCUS27471 [Geodia barretti]|uniref:Uncharacterized protein n=1 Tax=Geodia barretti TaxID=519541 RepID=A0AA35TKD2_GEOBA|nr:hypothetical protein GBAR_LOCUS27471 [Geodia barretti]
MECTYYVPVLYCCTYLVQLMYILHVLYCIATCICLYNYVYTVPLHVCQYWFTDPPSLLTDVTFADGGIPTPLPSAQFILEFWVQTVSLLF